MQFPVSVFLFFIFFTVPCIAQDEWENPEIMLELKPRERAIKQFPYQPKNKKQTHVDVKGFHDFGKRMSDKFLKSGLTEKVATVIYQLIAEENIVRHESYGMPSPGQKKTSIPSPEDLMKIVSIKKIGEGLFEIFYSYYGCGTNYVHQAIVIEEGKIIGKSTIEKWSGSYPC